MGANVYQRVFAVITYSYFFALEKRLVLYQRQAKGLDLIDRHMKRLKRLLIILLVFVSVQQSYAQDQQAVYVGIQSETFGYFTSSQHNTNWCWAASIQMIFNYYG